MFFEWNQGHMECLGLLLEAVAGSGAEAGLAQLSSATFHSAPQTERGASLRKGHIESEPPRHPRGSDWNTTGNRLSTWTIPLNRNSRESRAQRKVFGEPFWGTKRPKPYVASGRAIQTSASAGPFLRWLLFPYGSFRFRLCVTRAERRSAFRSRAHSTL
jgi:hypothetical protein